jgi:predicted nucleic acid-binding protein
MRLVDVNVLVYAHRLDAPRHADYAAWLRDLLAGQEPYGISDLVLSGSSGS